MALLEGLESASLGAVMAPLASPEPFSRCRFGTTSVLLWHRGIFFGCQIFQSLVACRFGILQSVRRHVVARCW